MRRLVVLILAGYKRFVSPLLPSACRFHPTCSEYMREAVEKYGAGRGIWLGLKRLVRCQPFCKGGYDPVPGFAQADPRRENRGGGSAGSESSVSPKV